MIEPCQDGLSQRILPWSVCSCDWFQECRTPFQAQKGRADLQQRECMEFFFPQEKILFSKRGGKEALWAVEFPVSPRAGGKGEQGSFPEAAALPGPPPPTCVVKWHLPGAADTAVCVILRWSRIKQKPENVLESHKCPKQETKNKTKSTEKVERLQDNRRGLSVVIYNRDCKMVN